MDTTLARLASTSEDATVIALTGSITADNSHDLGDALADLRAQHPEGSLTLDADALE